MTLPGCAVVLFASAPVAALIADLLIVTQALVSLLLVLLSQALQFTSLSSKVGLYLHFGAVGGGGGVVGGGGGGDGLLGVGVKLGVVGVGAGEVPVIGPETVVLVICGGRPTDAILPQSLSKKNI